jgi:hypothetical protein
MMNIPNFHDGHFDGLWIGDSKVVHLFLRTQDKKRFTLVLQGVHSLILSEIKEGNIIFDLVFRPARELTTADIAELYGVGADAAQAANLLTIASEQGLQLLEVNPSYGAHGLLLFETFELRESTSPPSG